MSIKTHKQHFARTTLGAGRFVAWCGRTVPADRIIRPGAVFDNRNACRLCWSAIRRSAQAAHRERMAGRG